MPAAMGLPHRPVRAPIVPQTPSANALRLGGNSLRLMASPLGDSIAIAIPWRERARIKTQITGMLPAMIPAAP